MSPAGPAAARRPRQEAAPRARGRRERRKREVRERILEAARGLFATHGFEGTTVEKIAALADVAPATFFNHFQSKQALLGLLAGEVVDHLQALLQEEFARSDSARERLLGVARTAGTRIDENQGVARHVVLELVRTQARPGDPAPYLARVHGPIAAMLAEGQARGEVRDDQDAAFLAAMVVGMLNAPVTRWLSDPDTPIGRELERAAGFAWDAVRARGPSAPDAFRREP